MRRKSTTSGLERHDGDSIDSQRPLLNLTGLVEVEEVATIDAKYNFEVGAARGRIHEPRRPLQVWKLDFRFPFLLLKPWLVSDASKNSFVRKDGVR